MGELAASRGGVGCMQNLQQARHDEMANLCSSRVDPSRTSQHAVSPRMWRQDRRVSLKNTNSPLPALSISFHHFPHSKCHKPATTLKTCPYRTFRQETYKGPQSLPRSLAHALLIRNVNITCRPRQVQWWLFCSLDSIEAENDPQSNVSDPPSENSMDHRDR